jgi:hypothetical protein
MPEKAQQTNNSVAQLKNARKNELLPKKKLVHHARLIWVVCGVFFGIIIATTTAVSNIGQICSLPTVNWAFTPVCSYLTRESQQPSKSSPVAPPSTKLIAQVNPHPPAAPPPVKPVAMTFPTTPPRLSPPPWPVVGLTVADEKTLPIAIRAQEQNAPGHFLDRPTANALFKLLKSENFNVVNETTSLVDESKIALFIDLDVTPQPLLPSPPMTCDVDKTTSVENVSVQVNLTWNDGETLYSPTPIFGTGFGCPDQTDYESTANMGAATDAAKKIYEQISSLASSK